MPGYNSQIRDTARTLPKLIVLLCLLFVCKCVLYCTVLYCTTATGCQPNCIYQIYLYIYLFLRGYSGRGVKLITIFYKGLNTNHSYNFHFPFTVMLCVGIGTFIMVSDEY